jgi:hypothetical protein
VVLRVPGELRIGGLVDECVGLAVEDAMALLDDGHAEGLSEVALPRAGRVLSPPLLVTNLTARLSPSEPRRRRRTISPSGNAGRASRHEGGNCHLDDQRATSTTTDHMCGEAARKGRAAIPHSTASTGNHRRDPRILSLSVWRRQGSSPMPRIRQLTGGACGGVDSEENVSAPWKKNWWPGRD